MTEIPWKDACTDLQTVQKYIKGAVEKLRGSSGFRTDNVKENRLDELVERRYLEGSDFLDLTTNMEFFYSTSPQVEHFVEIERTPDFSGLENLLSHKHIFTGNLFMNPAFEIVDYGCGNGLKGLYLHFLLNGLAKDSSSSSRCSAMRLVDYNDMILQVATNFISDMKAYINGADNPDQAVKRGCAGRILTTLKNLEEDTVRREKNDGVRLHLLLGQTIGNFRNVKEAVSNLNESMKKGELLIVEWYYKKPEDYEHERSKKGLLNLLHAAGFPKNILCCDEKGHYFGLETNKKGEGYIIGYQIVSEDFSHRTGLRFKKGTKIKVLRSRRFGEDELIGIFTKEGFDAHPLEEWEEVVHEDMGGIPVTGKIVRKQTWESHGDLRYAIFSKKHENRYVLSRWLVNTMGIFSMALIGVFGYIKLTEERPTRYEYGGIIESIDGYKKNEKIGVINTLLNEECRGTFQGGQIECEVYDPCMKREKKPVRGEIEERCQGGKAMSSVSFNDIESASASLYAAPSSGLDLPGYSPELRIKTKEGKAILFECKTNKGSKKLVDMINTLIGYELKFNLDQNKR